MIYIGMFFLSYVFMKIYERKKGNSYIRFVCLAVALFLPSLLAGLRADSIGTDVLVYAKSVYCTVASFSNFGDFFNFWSFNSVTSDPFYFLLTFLLAKTFSDYHFGLFVYQLLIEILFFMGSRRVSEKYKFSISLLILWIHLCLYNVGLNAIRQMIAVSMLFYFSTFLMDNKIKQFVIGWIFVIFWHSSALLGVVILGVYVVSYNKKGILTQKQSITRCVLFISAILLIIVMMQPMTSILVNYGFLRGNYLNYLSGGIYQSAGLPRSVLIAPFIYLSTIFLRFKNMRKNYELAIFFLLCAICNFAFSFGAAISTSLLRITFYFIPFVMVGIMMAIVTKKKNCRFWLSIITIILLIFGYIDFVVKGYNETYPYEFYWSV